MPPRTSIIAAAVARLREGGLVAFPTETVYGLGADALNAQAVARVFALKGRPARNPLIVHVADEAMARSLASDRPEGWSHAASLLARALWPGPLTLVVPKRDVIPGIVTAGGPNVALRCPDHPLTLELLRQFGRPLVGPSANRSGSISPTTASHVGADFPSSDVLILDGGPCRAGIESTVLLLTEHPPRILRPGLISAERISTIIKAPVADFIPGLSGHALGGGGGGGDEASTDASTPLLSPGLLERHYAPTTPARLVGPAELPAMLREADALGRLVVVIAHLPTRVHAPHRLEPLPQDAFGYAAGLYAALRAADERRAHAIAILRPEYGEGAKDAPTWKAILDRLRRATA